MQQGSPDPRRFPETQWSRIVAVSSDDPVERRARLQELLTRYWKPTLNYACALRPHAKQEAEDLTQGFFAAVLARVDFSALSPERGSFRSFLKVALRRHIISVERSINASREREQATFAAQAPDATVSGSAAHPSGENPEDVFDRAWIRAVLDDMLTRLRDELRASGREAHWTIFQKYCLDPVDGISYETVAHELNLTVEQVRKTLRNVRKRSRELVREIVTDYLLPDDDIETELRFILGA